MTLGLRRTRPWRGHSVQESNWRQVPRISLLPREKASPITPLVLGLLALLVVEGLALQYLYRDMSSINGGASDLSEREREREVLGVESAIADHEDEIRAVRDQLESLTAEQDLISLAYARITTERTDWASSIDALLRAETPDVRFTKIEAKPGGKVEAAGTAAGPAAMVEFQDRMRVVEDIHDLQSLKWEEGDSALLFTASIQVK